MAKFRKKVIVVDAKQWWPDGHPLKPKDALPESEFPEVKRWSDPPWSLKDVPYGEIETLEGKHIVTPGDWIITGVKGEKYPCKDDIFKATYEPVD